TYCNQFSYVLWFMKSHPPSSASSSIVLPDTVLLQLFSLSLAVLKQFLDMFYLGYKNLLLPHDNYLVTLASVVGAFAFSLSLKQVVLHFQQEENVQSHRTQLVVLLLFYPFFVLYQSHDLQQSL